MCVYIYVYIYNIYIFYYVRHTSFYCASQILLFYKLKVCGDPELSKAIGTIFPTIFAHFMSLCHNLIIQYFRHFHYYYISYGDL